MVTDPVNIQYRTVIYYKLSSSSEIRVVDRVSICNKLKTLQIFINSRKVDEII